MPPKVRVHLKNIRSASADKEDFPRPSSYTQSEPIQDDTLYKTTRLFLFDKRTTMVIQTTDPEPLSGASLATAISLPGDRPDMARKLNGFSDDWCAIVPCVIKLKVRPFREIESKMPELEPDNDLSVPFAVSGLLYFCDGVNADAEQIVEDSVFPGFIRRDGRQVYLFDSLEKAKSICASGIKVAEIDFYFQGQ